MAFDRELPILKILVNGHEDIIDPNIDLKTYEDDLINEFSEQPPKYAFYAGLYSDALVTLEQYKNILAQYEATNELAIRERVVTRLGNPKPTIGMVEAEFARDDQWQKLTEAIMEWKRTVGRLEAVKEAFKQRAQMLWSLGATRRAEMGRFNPSQNNSEE